MKRIIVLLLCLAMLIPFASCKKKANTEGDTGKKTEPTYQVSQLPSVVKGSMSFLDIGTIEFELYPKYAPESVLNFIYLAKSGHFNGVIVDKIVKDVSFQAGTYQSGYVERNTEFEYTIKGEFEKNGVENPLAFLEGTMAWVLKGDDYNSAQKEFVIYTNSKATWDLAGKSAAFGMVVGEDSLKVLQKINKKKTYAEKPVKEIMITSVVINPVTENGFDPETYEFPKPNFIKSTATATAEPKKDDSKKKD